MYIAIRIIDRNAEAVEVFTDLGDAVLYANVLLNTYRQRYNIKEMGVDAMWGEATKENKCAWCNSDEHDFDVHIVNL